MRASPRAPTTDAAGAAAGCGTYLQRLERGERRYVRRIGRALRVQAGRELLGVGSFCNQIVVAKSHYVVGAGAKLVARDTVKRHVERIGAVLVVDDEAVIRVVHLNNVVLERLAGSEAVATLGAVHGAL